MTSPKSSGQRQDVFITHIQHSTGSSSHYNKARKGNTMCAHCKGGNKTLFALYMTDYTEKSQDITNRKALT